MTSNRNRAPMAHCDPCHGNCADCAKAELEQHPVPSAGVALTVVLAVPAWVISVALAAALLPPQWLATIAGWLA